MSRWDIENSKLGFESPESRELFQSISFFEKILEKKVQKNFLHFGLILGYFSYCNKEKVDIWMLASVLKGMTVHTEVNISFWKTKFAEVFENDLHFVVAPKLTKMKAQARCVL